MLPNIQMLVMLRLRAFQWLDKYTFPKESKYKDFEYAKKA